MCFEKTAKPLLLSLDSFPLADDFNNFTSFFIWQVKGSQVLREIKLVSWSGTMPGEGKQLHFPHRHVGLLVFARRAAWICSNQLVVLILIGCLKWAGQLAAVWDAQMALGVLIHFSPSDWMAYYLKARIEPARFAPACCGWPRKQAASPGFLLNSEEVVLHLRTINWCHIWCPWTSRSKTTRNLPGQCIVWGTDAVIPWGVWTGPLEEFPVFWTCSSPPRINLLLLIFRDWEAVAKEQVRPASVVINTFICIYTATGIQQSMNASRYSYWTSAMCKEGARCCEGNKIEI